MYLKSLIVLICLTLAVNFIASADEVEVIRKSMREVLPDLNISRIEKTPLPGMYMVMIGAEIFYVSANGKYLIRGDLIDLANRNNLSEQERTVARAAIIKDIPEDQYIEFAPARPMHTLYVFTDITCGFCQKLQHEISQINEKGIAIRYLAFPREGANTVTSKQMESVWCAKNRKQALTDAMIGLGVKPVECVNPVNAHFELGQAMGVRGTPAIYSEDGRYLSGYMSPDELLSAIKAKPAGETD
jgi:thiol:disulfide interchange protein DsbC